MIHINTLKFSRLFVLVLLFNVYGGSAFSQVNAIEENVDDYIIRVELKAKNEAVINSPMTGQVVGLSVRDGDRVKNGQTLVKFNCGEFNAQLNQANARVTRQKKIFSSTEQLFDLGSASIVDLNVLRAELEEANAAQSLAKIIVRKCSVKAPFNGNVSSLSVKNHSSLLEGEKMIEIIGGDVLGVEMIVPSKWMKWLKVGSSFQVEIEETGLRYKSKVVRYGGKVDPITQSIKLYGQIEHGASELLPGMSGTAHFNLPSKGTSNVTK